ncbi:MAG: hypothetical protein IPO87_14445 [Flavobacteriales bacterium]|nr:hypothetical protein [Flavobacteriales bacterium]
MPAFRSIALALLLSGAHALCGQSIRDTTIALFAVHASYAQQLPGGDLAERFGTNSNIGLGTFRKTKSNFLLGVEGSFIFGKKTKEPGILRNVINSQGQVVDVEGKQADVFLYERGWTAFAYVGKTFQLGKPNPNSGVVIKWVVATCGIRCAYKARRTWYRNWRTNTCMDTIASLPGLLP